MIEIMEIYADLCNKRPLIYQIGEQYYVLGYHTFRSGNSEELTLYEELKKTYNKETSGLPLASLNKTLVSETVQLFEQLKKLCDNQNMNNDEELNCFINELSQSKLKQVDEQMKWYHTLYNFADGAFYRFSKE